MTTDNFCFYLQNRLIQTSQTGGQQYSVLPPLVFPGKSKAYSVYRKVEPKYYNLVSMLSCFDLGCYSGWPSTIRLFISADEIEVGKTIN
jgi:hypothetical protein